MLLIFSTMNVAMFDQVWQMHIYIYILRIPKLNHLVTICYHLFFSRIGFCFMFGHDMLAHRRLVVARMCDFPLVHLPTGGAVGPLSI